MKHVELDCYFVREHIESNDIESLHIDNKEYNVDLFMKTLGEIQLLFLLYKLAIFLSPCLWESLKREYFSDLFLTYCSICVLFVYVLIPF